MDKAIRLIHEYCESEFGTKANLSNMNHMPEQLDSKISDPYFMKITPDKLSMLQNSDINFKHCESNGEIIIKLNRCDREKAENLFNAHSKQIKPKL